MPGDSYHREFEFAKPREECWNTLIDVDKLASWVEILHSVETIEPLAKYTAILESRVGPMRLKAPLSVEATVGEQGGTVSLHAAGNDPQVNSSITIDITMALADAPNGGTHVTLDATYAVLGKVASMGGGIIKKKADKVLEEFTDSANAALG